ncbi:unnamed protein product [Pedinophyceae sp. YPF-701]|nr:unnamed protein product [Pedinophyceae sp. YPF-701]
MNHAPLRPHTMFGAVADALASMSSQTAMLLLAATVAPAVVAVTLLVSANKDAVKAPRVMTTLASLPWPVGSAVALGVGNVAFVAECARHACSCFSLVVFGKNFTFMTSKRAVSLFFTSRNVTFLPAVEQWTSRIFRLPATEFRRHHQDILSALRQAIDPRENAEHMASTCRNILSRVGVAPGETRTDLVELCHGLAFEAGVRAVFGDAMFEATRPRLRECFETFEDQFELAASPLPHALLRNWSASRKELLCMLEEGYSKGWMEGSMAARLVDTSHIPRPHYSNVLLSLLWASQANTAPGLFWTTAFLLLPENEKHLRRVLAEARDAAARGSGDVVEGCVQVALDGAAHIHRCVAEALRLRSPGIAVRFASMDVEVDDRPSACTRIPRGRTLAICPFYLQHHPEFQAGEPWRYDPDRVGLCDGLAGFAKGQVSGVVWGGGVYRCPGRRLAETELALLSTMILTRFEATVARAPRTRGASQDQSFARRLAARVSKFLGWRALGVGLPDIVDTVIGMDIQDGDRAATQQKMWKGDTGDPNGVLPPYVPHKLVGIRIPFESCPVVLSRRVQ